MSCFTDIPAIVSYSSCLMSIVCMCISTFGAIIACRSFKKSHETETPKEEDHYLFSVKCKNCNVLWDVNKNGLWEGCKFCASVDDEDEEDHPEEKTEEEFLEMVIKPFELPEDYAQTLIDSCIIKSKDNTEFSKDALFQKSLALLHWHFNERKNEESKKDE